MEWVAEVPDSVVRLAEHFWPGPLTIILRRARGVLDEVAGGQDTIGLRVPANPLAQRLLAEFGGGIAAPSANRFGRVSPTMAAHVLDDVDPDVDFVLDGGPCEVGIESTIVDFSGSSPVILRPGGVTSEAVEEVVGNAVPVQKTGVRAPGSHTTHYAPRAHVRIVLPTEVDDWVALLASQGVHVEPLKPEAPTLYAAFRESDRRGIVVILVPLPPEEGLGLAIRDRLQRASGCRSEPKR